MVKIPNLDDLKALFGPAALNHDVLPDDIKKQMESVEVKLQAFTESQKKFGDAANELKKEVVMMCQNVIALYTPKEEKPAAPAAEPASAAPPPTEPAAAPQPEAPKEEAPPAEQKAQPEEPPKEEPKS